jgi:hypothetical protein
MTANAWHAPRSANKMVERIRNLATELQIVQQELYAELAFPDGTPRKNVLGIERCGQSDLRLLRDAVDQFRRVLWFYDQTEPEQDGNERKPPVSARTGRSDNVGRAEQGSGSASLTQHPVSFFDRLDMVIEGYLQAGGQLRPSKPKVGLPGTSFSAYRKPPKA